MKAKHWIIVFLALAAGLGFSSCRPAQTVAPTPAATAAPTATENPNAAGEAVTVADGKFILAGSPYYFVGAHFWRGMNLSVNGPSGDREQLDKQFDHLKQIGVTNLRVMASSEGLDQAGAVKITGYKSDHGNADGVPAGDNTVFRFRSGGREDR